MPLNDKTVLVKPVIKRNGITLTLLGFIALIIGIAFFLNGSHLFAVGIVFFALGAISTVLGISKLIEPEVTIKLTAEGLTYFHRRGQLFVSWNNIQRFDQPRVVNGLDMISLPYIGIKLKLIAPILDSISLRLAAGLLTEQRPLLMTASTQDEDLSTLENQMSAEFTPFIEEGDRYKGVLAMFGHRTRLLGSHLGYHIYISTDALDRSGDEFISLLNAFRKAQN
ncbi:DUF2982 domain-containing protein [Shewanella sairae]|uniref:DUF2982 domain-containing protein n=1 Tax=Shewanella sairae TaxID=190310 RepID=UPI001C7E3F42|nr:DUF2982 domain-containing protein [Shewanella sairae]MCL1131381.1 DUF2982 domain-containing protein [Shewanella sairae]